MSDHLLRHGRACYERWEWNGAHRALSQVDRDAPLEPDDLERLAISAYLLGREDEFLQLLDRLHRTLVDRDDRQRAARCAFWLGLICLFRGEAGQSNAWVARGERLVQDLECPERGYLQLPEIERHLHERRADQAYATSAAVFACGRRFADADLTAIAAHLLGRARIQEGDITGGLRFLDETMLAVVAGELSPIVTGLMYCSVIDVCRGVHALPRAREWTLAMTRWCEQQKEMVAFTGLCLVHRAEILQFQGAWPDAMAEASRACERSRLSVGKPSGAALYQQGELYRLRGEFTEAEAYYHKASEAGYEPQPGLALLRLAQGHAEPASTTIRRVMNSTLDQSARARLYPAFIDIVLAAGELDAARAACAELEKLADFYDTDVLRAAAAQARGATELAGGDARAALISLRQAFRAWDALAAPYDLARARVLLGSACLALGDDEAASLEFSAARGMFEHLGAAPDLARIRSMTPSACQQSHPLTSRELDVLRMIASGATNKAIAAALGISERTVDRHVSNILNKLGVPSRAAATAYAYDHKFL